MKSFLVYTCLFLTASILQAQPVKRIFALIDTTGLTAINVAVAPELYKGKKELKVADIIPGQNTELRIVKLADESFHNGTIEVELAGEPMKNSSEDARGFVGIAFRVDRSNTGFECFYLRPTNGRANEQVRRNHSAQYISYPDYPWYKLREQFPEKYETYVDLEPAVWTKMRIEVNENSAKLFVHDASQPSLIVSDLKLGNTKKGAVALWIGPGTEAHFRNLVITKRD